jgi:ribosomal protein L11 methyltransferase
MSIAEFIEKKQGLFEDFFDIGTGTGILSMVAGLYGAKKIWAVDISKESVETAQRNFASNNCRVDYLAMTDLKQMRKKHQFDFVAANLLSEDLISMRNKIIGYVKKGKYLAVSGISVDNYGLFRKRFDKGGLRCLRVRKSDGWAAVLYKKL